MTMNSNQSQVSVSSAKEPHFQLPPAKGYVLGVNAFFVALSMGLSILLASFISSYVLPLWDHTEANNSLAVLIQSHTGTFSLTTGFLSFVSLLLLSYYLFGKNKPYWMNPRNLAVKKVANVALCASLVAITMVSAVTMSIMPSIAVAAMDTNDMIAQYQNYKNNFNHSYLGGNDTEGYYNLKQYSASSDTCNLMNKSVKSYVDSPLTSRVSAVLRKNFIADAMRSGCMSPAVAYALSDNLYQRAGKLQFGYEKVIALAIPAIRENNAHIVSLVAFNQKDWCHNLVGVEQSEINDGLYNRCNTLSNKVLTALPPQKTALEYIKAVKQSSLI